MIIFGISSLPYGAAAPVRVGLRGRRLGRARTGGRKGGGGDVEVANGHDGMMGGGEVRVGDAGRGGCFRREAEDALGEEFPGA